ncbi:hypothetical protein Tco_0384313, partial [Tanacetum coccineum]
DPEKDDDVDLEEDPFDYPADRGDDGDDEDESSDDDKDEDVDIDRDEEEEEHPASADSTDVALPAVDQPHLLRRLSHLRPTSLRPHHHHIPHPAYRVTAWMLIQDEPPTTFWFEAEVARLLAVPSPPASLLSPWSSPLPQIPLPPLPVSPPPPSSPTYPLGY